MKKALLASTALVGASLLTAGPAAAGQVGVSDNFDVSLGAFWRIGLYMQDHDLMTGRGRGYAFRSLEGEVYVRVRKEGENGLLYGMDIELNALPNDNTAADESFMFIDSDQWGRVELGDQDGALNRMSISGRNALKGHLGFFGGLAVQQAFSFGGALNGAGELQTIRREDAFDNVSPLFPNGASGDSTKAIYFTPRFSGFQLGASWLPDVGISGGIPGDTDNDGDWGAILELGANYVGTFDDTRVTIAVTGATAEHDPAPNAGTEEDLAVIQVGGKIDFAGWSVAVGYRDYGDSGVSQANKALGRDAGAWYSMGLSYSTGPWGLSVGYFSSNVDKGTSVVAAARDSEVEWWNLGASYSVAPGWTLLADLALIDATNISDGTTDNAGTAFVLTSQFAF